MAIHKYTITLTTDTDEGTYDVAVDGIASKVGIGAVIECMADMVMDLQKSLGKPMTKVEALFELVRLGIASADIPTESSGGMCRVVENQE